MENQTRSQDSEETGTKRAGSTLLTAVRHSSGLIAFLGVFVAVSAYSTEPRSRVVTFGVIMAIVGVLGFLGGMIVARRRGNQGTRAKQ